jgi:hypothetical protein
MTKIWKKCFRQKNQLFLLLLLTVIQCKQRYIRIYRYIITLQCYRSGFKIIFSISEASKFSIMQDAGLDVGSE